MSTASSNTPEVAIRYEQTGITHTTQFVLSANAEEVVIDCSSGPIPAERGDGQVLPIQARHALPWSAVRRLSKSLQQMIEQYDRQIAPTAPKASREAGLPRIEDAHVN